MCGLSKQASSEAVSLLEEAGIIEAGEMALGSVGRRPLDYHLASDGGYGLAFDIGGTKILSALISLRGEIIGTRTAPTDERGGLAIVDQLKQLAGELFAQAGKDEGRLLSVALGIPGVPDPSSGLIKLANNLKDWDGLNLHEALAERFPDARIGIENDVNLAALGELQYSGGSLPDSFGFINVGTGISLGIVLDGAIVRGATGAAGEIGFLPIVPSEDPSSGRRHEHLEEVFGSYGLLLRHNRKSGTPALNVKEIFARAEAGDELAEACLDEAAFYLSIALLSVRACIDLGTFVFGGSIGMQDLLIEKVRHELATQGAQEICLQKSQINNEAGIYGAMALAGANLYDTIFHFSQAGETSPRPTLSGPSGDAG